MNKDKGKRNLMLLASLKQQKFRNRDTEIKINYVKKQYSEQIKINNSL
jgi:hypothetical protein